MKYELIVFDWDGTLMDSQQRIVACVQNAVEDLGLNAPSHEAVSHIIGLGLTEAIDALFPGADASLVQQIAARYREHFLSDHLVPSQLFEGARMVIEQLSKQYVLAIATGKSRVGLDKVLEQTGLDCYFQTSRCADETRSKPHPQMLEDIMMDMEMLATDTLMIGDTTFDIEMAKNAGVHSLGVSYGVHGEMKLRESGALDCLHTIADLPQWLQLSAVN